MPRSARRAALAWHAAALVPMVWTLGACAEPTEPRYRPDDFYPAGIAFGAADDPQFVESTSPPLVRIRPGRVVILGVVAIPCFSEETGIIEHAGDTVTVRIGLRPWSGPNHGCARGHDLNYRATVELGAGAYVLRIRHEDATAYLHERAIAIPPSTD